MIPQKRNIVLVDGGFSTQLSRYVAQPIDGDVLWSARFLSTHPEAVIQSHLDFLKAGADVIITNTYQASLEGFREHLNLTAEESYNLIKAAVQYAKIAVDKFKEEFPDSGRPTPLIVGSVGPYGASLHDGSEYTGSYATTTSIQTMRDWHRPRINALIEGGVNILALETIPCRAEAETLIEMIKEYPNIKAWLSFSCNLDGKSTAYGEDFQETVRYCYDLNPKQLVAVGANCLAPKLVEDLFKGLNDGRENNPVPLIVYPNSGEKYDVQLGWIDKDKADSVASFVRKWLDIGITHIGGCCRTDAEDLRDIAKAIKKWQNEQNKRCNNIIETIDCKNGFNYYV